jgi:hypothetical protein
VDVEVEAVIRLPRDKSPHTREIPQTLQSGTRISNRLTGGRPLRRRLGQGWTLKQGFSDDVSPTPTKSWNLNRDGDW